METLPQWAGPGGTHPPPVDEMNRTGFIEIKHFDNTGKRPPCSFVRVDGSSVFQGSTE